MTTSKILHTIMKSITCRQICIASVLHFPAPLRIEKKKNAVELC